MKFICENQYYDMVTHKISFELYVSAEIIKLRNEGNKPQQYKNDLQNKLQHQKSILRKQFEQV